MMHPMIPPATGPTGALLIMFREATSSSGRETGRRQKDLSRQGNDRRSSGSHFLLGHWCILGGDTTPAKQEQERGVIIITVM